VLAAERTFWEKATAAHVYCLQGRLRGERYSRHWYDLAGPLAWPRMFTGGGTMCRSHAQAHQVNH